MDHLASGSCLCGAVRFDLSGAFESFFLCHCSRCRKDTGSAHAANLFSTKASIRWIAGEDKIKTFVLPQTRHAKSFCAECGSALPTVQMEGKLLVVPAGALDSDLALPPTAHICCADRAPWTDEIAGAPRLDGMPR